MEGLKVSNSPKRSKRWKYAYSLAQKCISKLEPAMNMVMREKKNINEKLFSSLGVGDTIRR